MGIEPSQSAEEMIDVKNAVQKSKEIYLVFKKSAYTKMLQLKQEEIFRINETTFYQSDYEKVVIDDWLDKLYVGMYAADGFAHRMETYRNNVNSKIQQKQNSSAAMKKRTRKT